MKKALCLFLLVVMCFSLVACGETSSNSSKIEEPIKSKEPTLDIEQELVNICCRKSFCKSIKGFTVGTKDRTRIENGWKIEAKGQYWPVDEYGGIGDLMQFDIEFTATWDGSSSYYDIEIEKERIQKKY